MSKSKKTLLLVEDDSLLAMTETRWLSKAGYNIIHVDTGEKAIDTINSKKEEIDLILMDINLGSGIDGTDAAREILRMNDVPLLFLSSHTEKDVVEKTEKITSYGYVVKDSKDVVLLASINMAFKLFNANKALRAKEDTILKSQARLKRAEFVSLAGNWELHLKNKTIIASEGALNVYGFSNAELTIDDVQKLALPEYRPELDKALHNLIEHNYPYNVKFRIKKANTGELADIQSTAEYDKEEKVVFGVIKDITQQKIAEDAIKYERNLLRLLIDNIPDSIYFKDSDGLYLLNNVAHLNTLGANSQSEVIGKNPFDFFPRELAEEFRNEELELLKNGKAIFNKEETRIDPVSGEKLFRITNKVPVFNDEGKINGLIGISRNITELKKHELVIKENEEKYRQLFESHMDALFLIETETGRILEANKAASELYGYDHDEFLRLSNINLSTEHETTKLNEISNHRLTNLGVRIHKKKNGITFPVEIARSYFDFGNRKVHLASVRDITERKKVEQILLESEQRWKTAIEGNNQGLWDWNLITNEVYYSPFWKKMLGYEEEDIENHFDDWSKLVHADDLSSVTKEIEKYLLDETPIYFSEHRLRCKDGSYKWILDQGKIFSYDLSGKPLRMIGTHTDISKRKNTEEQLQEISEIFRLFLKYNPHFVFIKNSEIRPVYLSDNYEKMLGRPLNEILGRTMDELFPSELSPKMIEDDKRILNEGIYQEFIEELDGRTYSTIKFPIIINGKPKYLAGYTIDRTEDFQIKKELENQKRFFEQMYLQSATSTQILDKDGWCLRINPKLTELFGVKPEHIENHHYNIFDDAEIKRNGIDKFLRRVFDEHKIEQWEVHFDIGVAAESQNIKVNEKSKKWYSNTASPIVDTDGNLLYVVIQHEDITKRKEAEAQLQKYMEDLKAISATKDKFFSIISHDLKNPFHSINSALKLIMSEGDNMTEEERKAFLQGILNTSNRAYLLLENLLLWSRNQMGQIEFSLEKIELSEISRATIALIKNSSVLKNINLSNKIENGIFVKADRNMLETVLRNLFTNAIKFTQENGKIEIFAKSDDQFVEINVLDNGIGIEPENIEKLFKIDQPFSTQGTKNESGTGLGLILCKDFIERNGGRIWVESEFGKGSKFSFSLPIHR